MNKEQEKRFARALAQAMSLQEPEPGSDNYKFIKYHLKALLAFKTLRDFSSGKVSREYGKEYTLHYRLLKNFLC